MTKHFTEIEIENLRKNPYVKKISISTITYTQEFREFFINKYRNGIMPSQIVNDAGFDPKILGKQRIDNIAKRFKKMALRSEGFMDTRKGNSSCISTIEPIEPTTDNLTTEEQLERLKHKIKYLEQENDWLKKIEYLNRQAESKEKRKQPQMKNLYSSKK